MAERFSKAARGVAARDEARALKQPLIGTEHPLLGLIREGQGLGAHVLADAGLDLAELRGQVEAELSARAA